MEFVVNEDGLTTLMSRLSIERGYLFVDRDTFHDVPTTVDEYTNAILNAEGFTPNVGGDEFRAVRQIVVKVSQKYSWFG